MDVLASAATALYPSSPSPFPLPADDILPDIQTNFDPAFLDALTDATSTTTPQHASSSSLSAFERRIEAAIQANAQYQSIIMRAMDHLCSALDRCNDLSLLAKDIEHALGAPPSLSVLAPSTDQPALPYFKYLCGRDFPSSASSKHRDAYISSTRSLAWTPLERETLKKAVMDWNRTRPDQPTTSASSSASSEQDLLLPTENISWTYIAQQIPRKTAIECKIRWLQHDHPLVNKSKWSPSENNRLLSLARDLNNDWARISAQLDTSRPAVDCLKQYRILTESKREWTQEDDNRLCESIRLYGKNWQAVARHVGRPSNQCINRWSKSLKPNIVKGRWSPEEDAMLTEAVAAVGTVWKEVSSRVTGRTDAQCRERWVNLLDPKINRGKWTAQEDTTLLKLHDQGLPWSEISAKGFNGSRTDNHCLRRFSELDKRRKVERGELPASTLRRGRPPGKTNSTNSNDGTKKNKRRKVDAPASTPQVEQSNASASS